MPKQRLVCLMNLRVKKYNKRANRLRSCNDGTVCLGPLERRALAVLASEGEMTVADVRTRLNPEYAYTTVMTTLDRLHRKCLLERRKLGTTYIYKSTEGTADLQFQIVDELIVTLLACRGVSDSRLVTALLQSIGYHHPGLLESLWAELARKFEKRDTAANRSLRPER